MAASKIQLLPEDEALNRIAETVRRGKAGEAPFALVLGSGFSWGLVPTVKELISDDLPLWIKAREDEPSYNERKRLSDQERSKMAGEFWRQVVEQNKTSRLQLELNPQGIPIDSALAYQVAFDHRYNGALGDPALAREFQREVIDLKRPRLNAAHFFFGSIIAAQPGADGGRRLEIWKHRAAFSRLIVTTNFDPFLQTALQLAGRLYFMSDRPDLGMADIAFEGDTDAIHLVYIHGSIHRPFQAANDQDITYLREKNARFLGDVLKRQGVIVLGYNGWDDAIVEALAACDKFGHRLYWCGLEPDPLVPGVFGPRVPEILQKSTACYIQTKGAGYFMAGLCNRLVKGLGLLANPIAQIRDMLEPINLDEVYQLTVDSSGVAEQISSGGRSPLTFKEAKEQTLTKLKNAEEVFLGKIVFPPEAKPDAASGRLFSDVQVSVDTELIADLITELRTNVGLAEVVGNYEEVLKISTKALGRSDVKLVDRADFLLRRGVAHYFTGSLDAAITDWTGLVNIPSAPLEQRALALYNRGIVYGQKGDPDKAIADYTQVIEKLPGAPAEQIANALNNRGWSHYQKNDFARFLSDTNEALVKNDKLDAAAFNLGLALMANNRDIEALAAYKMAAERFPDKIESLGILDVRQAIEKWLSHARADPVLKMLESLTKRR